MDVYGHNLLGYGRYGHYGHKEEESPRTNSQISFISLWTLMDKIYLVMDLMDTKKKRFLLSIFISAVSLCTRYTESLLLDAYGHNLLGYGRYRHYGHQKKRPLLKIQVQLFSL